MSIAVGTALALLALAMQAAMIKQTHSNEIITFAERWKMWPTKSNKGKLPDLVTGDASGDHGCPF